MVKRGEKREMKIEQRERERARERPFLVLFVRLVKLGMEGVASKRRSEDHCTAT